MCILSYFLNNLHSVKLSDSQMACRIVLSAVPRDKTYTQSDVARLQPEYMPIVITVTIFSTNSCPFSIVRAGTVLC